MIHTHFYIMFLCDDIKRAFRLYSIIYIYDIINASSFQRKQSSEKRICNFNMNSCNFESMNKKLNDCNCILSQNNLQTSKVKGN